MDIITFLRDFSVNLNDILMDAGYLAPLFSSVLIVLEGTLAFLPLVVFVTINIVTLGPIMGSILSWILTVIGSFFAFYLCRSKLSTYFQKKINNKEKIKKFMELIDRLKFVNLVLIIAIPFAPSFFINVGAGLSNISIKKYLFALLVGKIFVIIFLGYVGYNLIECLTNPLVLIKIVVLLIIAYGLGKWVSKKYNLDEE